MTNSIALIELASVPVPSASRNFDAMRLAVQVTPVGPRLLLPTAPTVTETCDPWPWSSQGSQVLVIALKPCVPAAHVIVWPPLGTGNDSGPDQTCGSISEWGKSV